jgi:ABC-type transport system involved in multi-copper enzyme maturation permease subunit
MLSGREVGIIAKRELLRNLRSTKGIAMFALFFLGGLIFSMLMTLIVGAILSGAARKAGMTSLPDNLKRELWEGLLTEYYGADIAKHLVSAPAVLYALFEGTLVFLPWLVLLVGFDQLAGELQYRTIRYTVGRAYRSSVVVGKALGIWAVVSIMVLVLHLTVWIIVLVRRDASAAEVISWGGQFWLFSSMCAAAYVGYASVVSSLFRTPIVALFAGAGGGAVLWVVHRILDRWAPAAAWALPNAYEKLLVEPNAAQVLGGCALFVVWGALAVAGAATILARRDV